MDTIGGAGDVYCRKYVRKEHDMRENPTTDELWGKLFKSDTVSEYLDDVGDSRSFPSFSEYITMLCAAKGENEESVIKRGQIESSFGHRLFKGTRNPSRDTVLQLAFGLELDSDETQQLLKIARATALHPRVKRDAVIAYCLHHHMSFMDTQELLYENDLPTMGGNRSEK